MDTITVDLPGLEAGNEDMPVVISAMTLGIKPDHTNGYRIINVLEEKQFHRVGVFGEDAEIHPVLVDGGAKRKTFIFEMIHHSSSSTTPVDGRPV